MFRSPCLSVAGAAGLLCAGLALLAGCSAARPSAAGPAPTTGGGRTPAADPTPGLCRSYAATSAGARTPLDAMRTEAVLLPFVDLIELATRQTAAAASSATDARVSAAMREVVAAIDDVDAQGRARLPADADPARATVRLDPGRLAAALDGADRACAPHLRPR